MDTIKINRTKPTNIEFNLKVEGASAEEAKVRFLIHADGFKISISCSQDTSGVFSGVVPVLPFLEKGEYDCSVEVVINNQLFKALKSVISLTDEISVSVSTKSTTEKDQDKSDDEKDTSEDDGKDRLEDEPDSDKEEEHKEDEEVTPVKVSTPLSALALTKLLQTRNAAEEEEINESKKDKKVREILESMNITPTKPAKKRPSLKTITEGKRTKKLTAK